MKPTTHGPHKHKHLEMIQAVISRLASNSFSIKQWTVMLVSALFVLVARRGVCARLGRLSACDSLLGARRLLPPARAPVPQSVHGMSCATDESAITFSMNYELKPKSYWRACLLFHPVGVLRVVHRTRSSHFILLLLTGDSQHMASYRKVFFSFKWSDVTRSEVVRNSYVTKGRKASSTLYRQSAARGSQETKQTSLSNAGSTSKCAALPLPSS